MKSCCITTGIRKSSKWKQRLNKKFLKNGKSGNESEYKNYKNFFESVTWRPKILYCSNLIIKYKNNLRLTWDVIKDSIGETKNFKNLFPQKIITNNKIVTDTDVIAKHFNTYFTEIGPNFSKKLKYLQKRLKHTFENRILYNQKTH